MLDSLINFIWNNDVLVGAICTMIFFTIIRMYSRSKHSHVEKATKKLGHKLDEATQSIREAYESCNTGDSCEKDSNKSDKDSNNSSSSNKGGLTDLTCNQLDAQFYGELFGAAVLSGITVKLWWK